MAVPIIAGAAIALSVSLLLFFNPLQLQIPLKSDDVRNPMSEREIISHYMDSEEMNNCSVSLLDASNNTIRCRGPGSLVAVHIPDSSRELTIKKGSSATVNVVLLHVANAEGYPELTVVLGSNKSMSSEMRLENGTIFYPADYMYYGDAKTENNKSPAMNKEKTLVLKANETKTVAVTIDIPQNFPDELVNQKLGFDVLFDMPEKSQVNRSSFGGLGARNDQLIVTVVR